VTKLRENSKIKLLAEKVETREEYMEARQLGFHFFQGYYFCQPEMHQSHEVESNELLLFAIYKETLAQYLNYKAIGNLLEQDSNLTYKLLCYINSGGFPLRAQITSVKQALTYLGDTQLRSLLSLFVTAILASKKPAELTKMCVIRAKCCELVVKKTSSDTTLTESAFLTGMFSLLDAILDLTIEKVLERLPVSDDIKETLLDSEDKSQTPNSMALRAIKLLESGSWYLAEREADKLQLTAKVLDQYYQEAILWSEFFEQGTES
jgi:EAL and modified HD-GYP domain-containing signal transduction protein